MRFFAFCGFLERNLARSAIPNEEYASSITSGKPTEVTVGEYMLSLVLVAAMGGSLMCEKEVPATSELRGEFGAFFFFTIRGLGRGLGANTDGGPDVEGMLVKLPMVESVPTRGSCGGVKSESSSNKKGEKRLR